MKLMKPCHYSFHCEGESNCILRKKNKPTVLNFYFQNYTTNQFVLKSYILVVQKYIKLNGKVT